MPFPKADFVILSSCEYLKWPSHPPSVYIYISHFSLGYKSPELIQAPNNLKNSYNNYMALF